MADQSAGGELRLGCMGVRRTGGGCYTSLPDPSLERSAAHDEHHVLDAAVVGREMDQPGLMRIASLAVHAGDDRAFPEAMEASRRTAGLDDRVRASGIAVAVADSHVPDLLEIADRDEASTRARRLIRDIDVWSNGSELPGSRFPVRRRWHRRRPAVAGGRAATSTAAIATPAIAATCPRSSRRTIHASAARTPATAATTRFVTHPAVLSHRLNLQRAPRPRRPGRST